MLENLRLVRLRMVNRHSAINAEDHHVSAIPGNSDGHEPIPRRTLRKHNYLLFMVLAVCPLPAS